MPLLRAPRISPDGTALAFVDDAGRVAILDLETRGMSAVPFFALSEPIWLPDSSGVLVSGLPAGSGAAPRVYLPRSPVPLLDPASFGLDAAQVTALRVVRLDRGTPHPCRSRPSAVARHGRPSMPADEFAYLQLEAAGAEAGSPWLDDALDDGGERVMRDASARAGSVSFTPEPEAIDHRARPGAG